MAGIKGRSGRRSLRDEAMLAEVENVSVSIVKRYLNSKVIEDDIKMKFAVDIVKNMQRREVKHDFDDNALNSLAALFGAASND